MILRRIALRHYRGIEAREVRFESPGVTLVEGPNEVGKSSLAEAIDLIFELPDSSSHSRVKAVCPVHRDEGPEIEIEVETGGHHFVYSKRFRKRPQTELRITRPRAENLTGREAHDRAARILEESLDTALWKALRVEQGTGVSQAALLDSRALAKALDTASGGGRSGAEESALFARVEQEVERYFTPTGRARGELAGAEGKLPGARARVAELEERYRELERDLASFEQAAFRLRELDERLPRLAQEARRLQEDWAAVGRLQAQVDKARSEREAADLLAEAASKARDERAARIDEVETARGELESLEGKTSPAQDLLGESAQTREGAAAAVVERRDALDAASRLLALREADFELRRNEKDHELLLARKERIDRNEGLRREAQESLERVRVDDQALEELRECEIRLRQARARLAEGGPQLALHALSRLRVELNGAPLDLAPGEVHEEAVTDQALLALPGQLEVRIHSGASTEELKRGLAEAQRACGELHAQLGVTSLPAAVAANDARKEAHRRLASLRERIAEDLHDLTPAEMQAKLDRLATRVADAHAARPQEPPLPADADAARALREEAAREQARLAHALEASQQEHERARVRHEELSRGQLELRTRIETLAPRIAALEERLRVAREQASDEARVAAASEAHQRAAEAAKRLAELVSALERLDPGRVEVMQRSTQEALERAQQEQGRLQLESTQLGTRLEMQQEAGLFEELEGARTQLEHAERQRDAVARRAAAAKLLAETLRAKRDAVRRAYVRPLTERIERLGRIVFDPSFEVRLSDELCIESRTLCGRTVPFDSLSTGAREQLGLLARLAAALIVAPEEGVPVILDDALGNTDPLRLRSMGALLAQVGRECQVIVLTCTPDRFLHVAGARVERIPAA